MVNTHTEINPKFSGEVVKNSKDYAKVKLVTTKEMVADKEGLIHGGFIFSAADYAAMVAINEPNVVLAKAEVKFLAPSRVGDILTFEAKVIEKDGPKAKVEVIGYLEDKEVFKGIFSTFVTKKHVLEA